MPVKSPSSLRLVPVLFALALCCVAGAATAQVALSPDTSVVLGPSDRTIFDDEAAYVNPLGEVAPAALGPIPPERDLWGFESLANGASLLCFDGFADLGDGVVATPGDVVLRSVGSTTVLFDATSSGIPDGVHCDAVTTDSAGALLLSFDVAVALPGGIVAHDEDLVRVEGAGQFSLWLDGSAEGLPEEVDVDGAVRDANGDVLVSLDVSALVGGVHADDEDLLRFSPGTMTWSLAYDASAVDPDWAAADVDAVLLPEPGAALGLVAGLVLLRGLGRGRLDPTSTKPAVG